MIKQKESEQSFRLKKLVSKINEFDNLKIQVQNVEFNSNLNLGHDNFGKIQHKLDYLIKVYDKNVCKILS